jgi:NADPH:quinone reductase
MKSVLFRQYGDPAEVLAVEESPMPEPARDEARVRMLAAPVNPSDLLYVRGLYAGVQPRFPAPSGFEGVGIVDALGPGARDVARSQRVSVLNNDGGNWAEYAVVPARDLIPVPADIPDEQAASIRPQPSSCSTTLWPCRVENGCSSRQPRPRSDA